MCQEFASDDFNPAATEPCFCGSGNTFGGCCGSPAPGRPPPHGVVLRPGWLDGTICDELVAKLEDKPKSWLKIIDRNTGDEHLDPGRVTQTVDLQELGPQVLGHIRDAFEQVAEPELNCRIDWYQQPQILRYGIGGLFGAHADAETLDPATNQWHRILDRDVSLLLYLNDGFDGGHIRFTKFNFSHKPRRGDLLMFPSDHRYMHIAEPVTAGFRYFDRFVGHAGRERARKRFRALSCGHDAAVRLIAGTGQGGTQTDHPGAAYSAGASALSCSAAESCFARSSARSERRRSRCSGVNSL